jgi:hypothetical protein
MLLDASALQNAATADSATRSAWSLPRRVAFRFVFCYLVLYTLPFPIGYVPFTDYLSTKYSTMWLPIVVWFGAHVLRLRQPITIFSNGSGDTTYDYVLRLCLLLLAVLGTIVWSLVARPSVNYAHLDRCLRFYVRLSLGGIMLTYGALKIIQSKFPPPGLAKLLEPYGDASPMGLLWTFMGASHAYNVFAGAAAILGGVLLILPWFTTLGALITIGVVTNIFALNMCYDVPVKLFSFHLLLMAAFVAAPDLRRLYSFFLLNRSPEPAASGRMIASAKGPAVLAAAQLLLGAICFGATLDQARDNHRERVVAAAATPFYGIWDAEEFSVDGQLRAPLVTDGFQWRRLVLSHPQWSAVQSMPGTMSYYKLQFDHAENQLTLTTIQDPSHNFVLSVTHPSTDILLIEGEFASHKIAARLRRLDESKFLLTNRGFHWISEFPFNR